MEDREKKVLFTKNEINKRIKELANELKKDYSDSDLLVISLFLVLAFIHESTIYQVRYFPYYRTF